MKTIELTQGKKAIVDDEDYPLVSKFKWSAYKGGNIFYAHCAAKVRGKWKPQKLHRLLLGLDYGDPRQADHINGDGLDNRRCNLRIATHAQNKYNQGIRKGPKSSRFRGVNWCKNAKSWRARIALKGKQIHIGLFNDQKTAAQAYDRAATRLFGEFARLNLPG